MNQKIYTLFKKALLVVFVAISSLTNMHAQEYADSTGLVNDILAGTYEEYILAPKSVKDTFFIAKSITLNKSVIIRAKAGLGFKPVIVGNNAKNPSYLFQVKDVLAGADITLRGVNVSNKIRGAKSISNGTFTILSEGVNLNVKDCEFYDFPGYNTVAKVYNSGGNITLDSVLVYNCGGKIIQVNYKDDNSTPNYVPLIGDLTVKNSTFAKIYGRMFLELGAGSVVIDPITMTTAPFNAGANNITIDHCTFYGFEGVGVLNSKKGYTFAGDQAAVKQKLSITNSIFSKMDKNMDMDSASVFVLDHNYFDFGRNLGTSSLEDLSKYNPTNTKTVGPLFADTTNGKWNLTLTNKDLLIGSDNKPIGDPRWTKINTGLKSSLNSEINIYSDENNIIVNSQLSESTLSIFDYTGRLIRTLRINSGTTRIPSSKGLYLVGITNNNERIFHKVLLK
jgi:hypothetical protein